MNEQKGRELSAEEEKQYRDGMALYEMTKTPGFLVLKRWIEDRAYHTWVDPREIENSPDARKEWEWRELNAFWAATTARELLENIYQAINTADYLDKVKTGEISVKSMKI